MNRYIVFVCLLALALYVALSRSVEAFGGCEENCQKCYSLDQKEVREILTEIKAPDVKVINIKMGPVRGLWEVTLDDKGARGVMHVGFSKKYIVPGQIYETETVSNKKRRSAG